MALKYHFRLKTLRDVCAWKEHIIKHMFSKYLSTKAIYAIEICKKSFLTSQRSFLTSQKSFLTSQKSFLTSQKSFLTSQKSFLTSQKSSRLSKERLMTSSGLLKAVDDDDDITEVKVKISKKTPFKLHKLKEGPSTKPTLTSVDALKLYEKMAVIRKMENTCANLYKQKVIRGFCHLYPGEEAVAVGLHEAVRQKDSLITAYRCHGYCQLMSGDLVGVMAELTGRKTGRSRGKGGSMHMYAPRFYGGNGIVGAQVPLGAGIALAHKYRADGGVCFTLYGDGAANQGQVFEAMNMAMLYKLPCIFICENNGYGLGTSVKRSSACTEFYTRGDYIPGIRADGMDVIACKEAARFAVEYTASGKGPIVVECKTYRYFGHSMSDPGTTYRTREEVKEIREKHDPIHTFMKKIRNIKLATDEQIQAITKKVHDVVDKAANQAQLDPPVGIEELTADIQKKCLYTNKMVRGVHPGKPLKHFNVQR